MGSEIDEDCAVVLAASPGPLIDADNAGRFTGRDRGGARAYSKSADEA